MKKISACNLHLGNKFYLKSTGRKYTVIDFAQSNIIINEPVNYIIAIAQGITYAINSDKKVFIK